MDLIDPVWHPYSKPDSEVKLITRGEGAYLYDENDREFLDAVCSWWVNVHGHSNKYIAQKVFEQLTTLEHVIFAGYTHPQAERLAKRILAFVQYDHSKVFFSDNGSTAVEVAIKIVLDYHSLKYGKNKPKILSLHDGYHGDTFGAMSISSRSIFTKGFEKYLFDTDFIYPDDSGLEKLRSLRKEEYAGFIFEPLIQGAAGMKFYSVEFLEEAMKICKQKEILLIADEVMTGFYRTGKPLATHYQSVEPDLVCLSKGITGGTMALGATTIRKEIVEAFRSGDGAVLYHGHSFTGSPIACASANANLDLIEEGSFKKKVSDLSDTMKLLSQDLSSIKGIQNVRQLGSLVAFEVDSGYDANYHSPFKEVAINFYLKKGVIVRPLGNTIYYMLPYCALAKEVFLLLETTIAFSDHLYLSKSNEQI